LTASSAADPRAIARDVGEADRLAVVDFVHLATFTDGDSELEAELGDLYLTTAQRYLCAMQVALDHQRAWSAEAHALKGASGNLGACRTAALAGEAEFEPPSATRLQVLRLAVEDVADLFARRRV
jgi:HPt (histidine-containing phosphotransfer) domain-containing protein